MADDPDQDKWLEDANESVKRQAFYMKRALDNNNVREALKNAMGMTGELRTAKLSPKNYYELYMNVTDELREMELYFEDEDTKERSGQGGRSVVELYENVQHCGNIIPRLYLLITVAAVYIKSKRANPNSILIDLGELCRGVQHPMRGLFLRNYLSQISKNKLPDIGSEYEGEGGSVTDSIEFVLQNFAEMNKLWVRMQHQGAIRDRQKREKERRNLRQLVGTNLHRLSEMRGVNLETYQEKVLPSILEQIVNCKDVIAQEYLMDCVIQVFPDDFHLRTLETFLSTCAQLQDGVNVKDIIITLMNRLSNFAKETPELIPQEIEMFPLFHRHSSQIIEESSAKMALVDILALQVALVNFATNCYPDRLEYIDHVLKFTAAVLERAGKDKVDAKCVKQVVQLLSLPLDSLSLRILDLEGYGPLMSYLQLEDRKAVAVNIVRAVVKTKPSLNTLEKVDTLFHYIAPLIKDEGTAEPVPDDERFEFDQNQHLVARMFHLITHDNTDVHFKLYATARKHFGQGGNQRIEFTLPPLVFGALELARRIHELESDGAEVQVKAKKVLGFVIETIGVMVPRYPELALRLFLYAAQIASNCEYGAIAYQFAVQAFVCYEEQITDSKAQLRAITFCVASLQNISILTAEDFDTLASKATQHCAKLLNKVDQCRAVYNCAHLFWPRDEANQGHRDEKRVLACLQKSLKIIKDWDDQQGPLFLEILNKYLHFYDRGCPSIKPDFLKALLSLVRDNMEALDESESSARARVHYDNTMAHIRLKTSDTQQAERYNFMYEGSEGSDE